MNIAYIADINCIHGNKWINYFAQQNNVIIICYENTEKILLPIDPSIKVYMILPPYYPISKFLLRKKILKKLRQIMSDNEIDIIHSMYAVPYAFWGYNLDFKNHIITTRGSDVLVDFSVKFNNPSNFKERIVFYYLKKLLIKTFNHAKYITSTSFQQQEIIGSLIKDQRKLHLIRTGINVEFFENTAEKLSRNHNEKDIVLFSPRLISPLYNTDIIIDAIADLYFVKNIRNIKLILIDYISNPKYLSLIRERIDKLGLQDIVKILPTQDRAGMVQLYLDADIVVMIPKSDGTPVSGIEAMIMKKPLIIGNLSYDQDIFNSETVWKTKAFSKEAVVDCIIEILDIPDDCIKAKIFKAYTIAKEKASMETEIRKVENVCYQEEFIRPYQICKRCIMDTNDDPDILFDEKGNCNYCEEMSKLLEIEKNITIDEKNNRLDRAIDEIKRSKGNKKYDCILGVSGGVDSTYMAFFAKKMGLNPLVVHYDNGWDSETAASNIHKIVSKLGFDLYTYVNDWKEFRDIQVAFFKASVVDIELITDQAIVAILIKVARQHKVKHILYGTNLSTEAILPSHWYHWKTDVLNIKAIHEKYGKLKLSTYPMIGFFRRWYYDKFRKYKMVYLLDLIPFNKEEAKNILIEELNWKDYGGKHYESIFTRFYQSYYLPEKFKIDKRKAHLSTLICSGQITRDKALDEWKKPLYSPEKLKEDKEYVIKKLGLTDIEFNNLMVLRPKAHTDFPSYITRHYKYQAVLSKMIKLVKK